LQASRFAFVTLSALEAAPNRVANAHGTAFAVCSA
jgi:hypothetical protein